MQTSPALGQVHEVELRFEPRSRAAALDRDAVEAELLARVAAGTAGEWRRRAACRGRHALFFSSSVRGAQKVCGTCPVVDECRSWALSLPDSVDTAGVIGGLSVSQRRAARRAAG